MKTLFFTALIFLAACSDDSFRKVEEISDFRVLAIQSDDSEVNPGDSTNISLYVSDPKIENGRSITFNIEGCVDPGIGLGAEVNCDHDPTKFTDTLSFNTSSLGDLNTGSTSSIPVTIPASIFTGRSLAEQAKGIAYIVIFKTEIEGKELKVFRRILATNQTTLNANPTINQIELNGSVLSTIKPKKSDQLNVKTDAPETYSAILNDGSTETRLETYRVAWYFSKGEVNKPKAFVGDPVEYLSDEAAEELLVIAVVRDDRGGVVVREIVIP